MNHQKIVDSPHYHLWTDTLHARSLAQQANNKWDRGTYVRWTVTTAWTVLEIACQDALNEARISYSFREILDEAIEKKGFNSLNWSSGIWKDVADLQGRRKGYVHRFISQDNLFPDVSIADKSIDTIRRAVIAIYTHVNCPVPDWIQDDNDRGWDANKGGYCNVTVTHPGTNQNDPKVIKLCYVHLGKEKQSCLLPSGTDYLPYVGDLIQSIIVPISAIRVYEGNTLIHEKKLNMRGT
ncbi:MAG: hypothetical protein KAI79_03535 [Bacteroidales bacterium]|nr:hypothetical protein [Bacteroidales bacterium]